MGRGYEDRARTQGKLQLDPTTWIPTLPTGKEMLRASPTAVTAGMLWFMSRIPSFRKLLATGINECRGLVEALVTAAPQAAPPVSVATIRGIEP